MIVQKVLFTAEECEWLRSAQSTTYPPIEDTKWWESHSINYRFKNIQERIVFEQERLDLVTSRVEELGVNSVPTYKIIHYGKGGFFAPHIDSGRNHPIRRKTLLVQLSSEEDYSGGDMFVKDVLFEKTIGNTILFDSSLTHELKLIEGGNRLVMVTWLSIYNLENPKTLL